MEIIISIAIIGVLSSIIISNLNQAREKAMIAKAAQEVDAIATAIASLANDTREWPGHFARNTIDTGTGGNEVWDLGAAAAGLTSTDSLFPHWDGEYMRVMPTDPWGNNYFFDPDYDIGSSSTQWAAVVGSFGPNGSGQNVFDSDNIIQILEQ